MKVKVVTEGMPSKCEYCGATNEADGTAIDLRPYGRNGAWICFDCGMKPEHKAMTEQNFSDVLKSNDVVITK